MKGNKMYLNHKNQKDLFQRGEPILRGTLRSNFSPATYRTKDGSAYYKFRYAELDGGKFEVDIVEQPSYNGRDESANTVHRLPSSRGGSKICISAGHEPDSLESAKKLSMEWAELTHNYIKTGRTIDDQVAGKAAGNGSANKSNFFSWLFN